MKMIYVGSLATRPDRDSGWIREYSALGCDVLSFKTEYGQVGNVIIDKISKRLNIGKQNKKLQCELIRLVEQENPVWVHFRLPIEFDRKTILKIKEQNIIVTQYFNDDPFSNKSPFGLHWKFRNALLTYNAHFVYRSHNIESFKRFGVQVVEHCPPAYDPMRHFVKEPIPFDNFLADAAFIGHWEDDWRVDCLDALSKNDFSVILKGGGWERAIKNTMLEKLSPISHAFGEEYNHIYRNVVAGLCFFSKINNDSWTERALEIIAVGGVLVCERTAEAQRYFSDREEAYFFSSIGELIDIIKLLKKNFQQRQKVRIAGYQRLLKNGCTIGERAAQIMGFVERSRMRPEINDY